MKLTNAQQKGLKIAIDRYKNKEKYTIISGYAGTGKSTLVKFIISALEDYGIDPEKDVCYSAFTGKATQVLQRKGNQNVSTLHKLLYTSIPKPTGGYIRIPKKVGEIDYKIIIVDEVSMVPKTLIDLLFQHDCYIICLGDPFQLPSIDKKDNNGLLEKPNIFLDEIMRQAEESEIIRLSMQIRENKPIDFFKGKEAQILPQNELNIGMLKWADQVICATNATRINLNKQMRQALNYGELPQDGDKVICLRNYWDEFDNNDNALVNGTIGYLNNSFELQNRIPYYIYSNKPFVDVIHYDFETEFQTTFSNIEADKNMFDTGEPTLDWKTTYKLGKNIKTIKLIPKEFAYAYAITCHKAQGSEWDKVLIVEENFPFEREEHARWLYTAVTRSAEKVILVRG